MHNIIVRGQNALGNARPPGEDEEEEEEEAASDADDDEPNETEDEADESMEIVSYKGKQAAVPKQLQMKSMSSKTLPRMQPQPITVSIAASRPKRKAANKVPIHESSSEDEYEEDEVEEDDDEDEEDEDEEDEEMGPQHDEAQSADEENKDEEDEDEANSQHDETQSVVEEEQEETMILGQNRRRNFDINQGDNSYPAFIAKLEEEDSGQSSVPISPNFKDTNPERFAQKTLPNSNHAQQEPKASSAPTSPIFKETNPEIFPQNSNHDQQEPTVFLVVPPPIILKAANYVNTCLGFDHEVQ